MNKKGKIVVGISIGDVNGVGIEVVLKTFEDKRMLDFCTPVLFGSSKIISSHKKILNIETNIHEINSIQQIKDGELKSSMKGATSLSQLVLKMKGPVQKLKSLVPHCACT